MAGGGGTRFWPVSNSKTPKQFLNLSGSDAMINETIDRANVFSSRQDTFVVTSESQVKKISEVCANKLFDKNILKEPVRRNTAAAIGYAAMVIKKRYEDGIMCVFPADHFIGDFDKYVECLNVGITTAKNTGTLVTVGIKPTFPATGYGYIKTSDAVNKKNAVFEVEKFVEKPDVVKAESFLESGKYLWNSGIFIWKASTILNEIQIYLPELYGYLESLYSVIDTENDTEKISEIYPKMPSVSIDYGIMERSKNVKVIKGEFGWNDVGSWEVLSSVFNNDHSGNVLHGRCINIETTSSVLYSTGRLIATIGLSDVIVAETDKAVLVCSKDKAQDVKKIVEYLETQSMNEFL